jgi:hypothetical protein
MINPILSTLAAITLASPAVAGIHDFTPANSAPTRARAGQGQCVSLTDKSQLCYVKTSDSDYSIAILDISNTQRAHAVHVNCSTGRWHAYGPLSRKTLDLYMNKFCTHF